MDEELYEEVGTTFRFFLGWRHAGFAGYLAVLYGMLTLTFSALEKAPTFAWIVPLVGCPIGLLLWMMDVRTRDQYHAAIRAGRLLEGTRGGIYTQITERVVVQSGASPFSRITHTAALNFCFLGGALGMLVLSAYLFLSHGCGHN